MDIDSQLVDLIAAGVEIAALSTSCNLQTNNRNKSEIKILSGLMLPCPESRVPYSMQSCFDDGKEWPDLQWVEQQIIDKKIDL